MPEQRRQQRGETTLLLADDHPITRKALRRLLVRSGFRTVLEAGDGAEAVRMAADGPPDLAIIDFVMPVMSGLDAAREIRRQSPSTRIVMLSGYADAPSRDEARRAGAAGYVSKSATFEEVLAVLDRVSDGDVVELTTADETDEVDGELAKLTAREREILAMVAEGRSSANAAALLGLSVRTVEAHRRNIMTKLSIHTVAGLTQFAMRHRLV
jgi:two-component system response regulator NreC